MKKDGKYVIELLEIDNNDIRLMAQDHRCFAFLLDKPNIKKEDILLKVGIYHPASTDSEGNEHKEYYEFI